MGEIILNLILAAVAVLLLSTIIRGAPFVPSKAQAVESMVALAQIKPGEKTVDLGAGDGRIVIAFAVAGAVAHGYEINPFLVWWGRRRIRKLGLQGRAFMHWQGFWPVNLSQFSIVTVFGIDRIMQKLEEKLRRELRPGSRVLSNIFRFPTLTEARKLYSVYLYVI